MHSNNRFVEPNKLLPVFILFVLIQSLLFMGCSEPKVMYSINKVNETGIEKNDKIVILSYTAHYLKGDKIEELASECLSKSFEKYNKKLNLFPSKEFRKIAFADPNEICTDNTTFCQLHVFFRKPNLVEKVKSLAVRYIIIIEQKIIDKDYEGFATGMTGSIFFLSGLEQKVETLHSCTIYDLTQENKESGGMGLTSSGGSGVGCLTGIPLYWPDKTESAICKAFGDKVAEFIIEPSIFYEFSGEYLP
jgi:hypothetical protein